MNKKERMTRVKTFSFLKKHTNGTLAKAHGIYRNSNFIWNLRDLNKVDLIRELVLIVMNVAAKVVFVWSKF